MEVLEFGCGTGSTALTLAPNVRHIQATDVSPKMLEIARRCHYRPVGRPPILPQFVSAGDDASEEAQLTGVLAWRNAWASDDINALAVEARNELDLVRRAELYAQLQRDHRDNSPFMIMFQQNEQVARQANVEGFVSGPLFDLVFYRNVTK